MTQHKIKAIQTQGELGANFSSAIIGFKRANKSLKLSNPGSLFLFEVKFILYNAFNREKLYNMLSHEQI